MVSGFSGSGVVAETSAVEVDGLASFSHGQLHAIRPGQLRYDIRRRHRRQHRRSGSSSARPHASSRASFNCREETARRYCLLFVTGLLFYSFPLFSSNLSGDLVVYCLILHFAC
jgi:hypothetical protein